MPTPKNTARAREMYTELFGDLYDVINQGDASPALAFAMHPENGGDVSGNIAATNSYWRERGFIYSSNLDDWGYDQEDVAAVPNESRADFVAGMFVIDGEGNTPGCLAEILDLTDELATVRADQTLSEDDRTEKVGGIEFQIGSLARLASNPR